LFGQAGAINNIQVPFTVIVIAAGDFLVVFGGLIALGGLIAFARLLPL
jgi:hypothetical protein